MCLSLKAIRLGACAVAASLCAALPAFAQPPKPLSSADAGAYQAAFAAVRAGDFKTADARLRKVTDDSLAGYVQFDKLMHPARTASYAELCAWLEKYGDLPGAERIYNLAQKRAPAQDAAIGAPSVLALLRDVAERGLGIIGAPSPAARNAFYSGDAETAFRLAANSGERWIAGLSAFRLGHFDDARRFFEMVAGDVDEDDWLRAGGAYWAARAVIAAGAPQLAPDYLSAAAQRPWTFYGMLAEAQLGMEPAIRFDGPVAPVFQTVVDPLANLLVKASTRSQAAAPAADPFSIDPEVERLVHEDSRAHRAAALMQLGRIDEASQEITLGLAQAGEDEAAKLRWTKLGQELSVPIDGAKAASLGGFNPADYPTPPLEPKDGFTIDPAMVYAIVRQESRFNPEAVSRTGAVGLMQLMPETAARTAGNPKLKARQLQDPSLNLRLGQDYFAWLLQNGVGDDIVAAVAAYNGGPATLLKTQQQLGGQTDALMLIESLPAQETRAYVEKVLAGYWLYRRQFGGKTPSLEALASGVPHISAALDQAGPMMTAAAEQITAR